MKVRAKAFTPSNYSSEIAPYLNQRFVTEGKDYDVHAIAVFDGLILVQTVDDIGYPAWTPHVIFETVDASIPLDWVCRVFPETGAHEMLMLLGPEFVAKDEQSYAAMVELEADKVDQFWKRLDAMKVMDHPQ